MDDIIFQSPSMHIFLDNQTQIIISFIRFDILDAQNISFLKSPKTNVQNISLAIF